MFPSEFIPYRFAKINPVNDKMAEYILLTEVR